MPNLRLSTVENSLDFRIHMLQSLILAERACLDLWQAMAPGKILQDSKLSLSRISAWERQIKDLKKSKKKNRGR